MATISQEKLQELLRNAPAGVKQEEIMRGLKSRGITVESSSAMQAGQQASKDMQSGQTGGVFDPIGSISKTAQTIGSGVSDMVSGAAEALNPFSGADLGQRAQAAGKSIMGAGKAALTAGTAPLQPIIQEGQNLLERTPSAITSIPQNISQSFTGGLERIQKGAEMVGNPLDMSNAKMGLGVGKITAGAIQTVSSPFAGLAGFFPPQLGESIKSSLDFVKNVTGAKGTEREGSIDDMFDLVTTLIPGGAFKGAKSPALRSIADSVSLQKPLLQKVSNLMDKPFPNAKSLNTKNLLAQQAKLGGFTQVEKALNNSLLPKIKQYVQSKAMSDLNSKTFSSFMDDLSMKQKDVLDSVVRNNPGMLTTFDRTAQIFTSAQKVLGDASLPPKFSSKLQGFAQLIDKGGITMNDMTSLLRDIEKYKVKPKYAPQREFLETASTAILDDLQDTIQVTMPKLGQSLSLFNELKNSARSFIEADVVKKVQTYAEQGMKEQDAIIRSLSDTPGAIHYLDDVTKTQVESAVWQKILEDSTTVDGILDPKSFFKNARTYSASPVFGLLGDQAKYSIQLFSKLGDQFAGSLDQIDDVMNTVLGKAKDSTAYTVEGVKGGAKSAKQNIVSKVFGADYEDIVAGYKNPELAQAYQAGALNPFDKIAQFFDDVSSRRAGTAKEYGPIKEANATISLPTGWMDDVLEEKFKLTVHKKGIKVGAESLPLTKAEANKLFEEVVQFKNANTAQSFFTLRDRIGRLADFDQTIGKSDTLARVSRELYDKLNELGRPQIKGLKELDKPISEANKLFDDPVLRGKLFDKKGQIKAKFEGDDVVVLLNKSNKATLNKLEQLIPGITEQLQMMKAIENIFGASKTNKPGAYVSAGKAGVGGVLGLSTAGPVGAIFGALAGLAITPEMAFNVAKYFGKKNAMNTMKVPRFVQGTNVSIADDVVLPDTASLIDDAPNLEAYNKAHEVQNKENFDTMVENNTSFRESPSSLEQEALKYKSADELVANARKGSGIADEIKKGAKEYELVDVPMNKISYDYEGRYFANPQKSIETIQKYTKTKGEPIILNAKGEVIDGNHRVLAGLTNGDKTIQAYIPKGTGIDSFDNLNTRLQKYGDSYEKYFGKSKYLKTKQQLTNTYNKAHGR